MAFGQELDSETSGASQSRGQFFSIMNSIQKYGNPPYQICLLHGGPGAAGEMKPLAIELSKQFGVLELFQTEKTIAGQIEELKKQVQLFAEIPVILVGYSWGAWLAVLFTADYSKLVKGLILVGTPSFEKKHNKNLLETRLQRLKPTLREEAVKLLSEIKSGERSNKKLGRFGDLMSIADAFEPESGVNEEVKIDMDIYQSVWKEASELRDNGDLANCLKKIERPVIAIHGENDPHSIQGVEAPLSENVSKFEMIKLAKCGHTPWKEKYAKMAFWAILKGKLKEMING